MPSKAAPYGSWKSPITSDILVTESVGLGQVAVDGDDVYWIEARPAEAGRSVLVRRGPDGRTVDVTPPPFNVRSRVHEYGGGAYTVHDGTVLFVNFADQHLYRIDRGDARGGSGSGVSGSDGQPRAVAAVKGMRYADLAVDDRRRRLIAVREDHTGPGEAVNTLVAVGLEGDGAGGEVLASGNDFYSSPRLSPDGSRLAWLAWNHPNMPWDGTELWVGEFGPDGRLARWARVAGGPSESVFQPEWSPGGDLYFVSDRTGWWNLYRISGDAFPAGEGDAGPRPGSGAAEPLRPVEADFGLPQWLFGMSTYAFASPRELFCVYFQQGAWHLASLDTETLKFSEVEGLPYTWLNSLRAAAGKVYCLAASPTEPISVVAVEVGTGANVLRRSSRPDVDPAYVSVPEEVAFPTEGGFSAYAYFYRPTNPDFTGPSGERPPVIVVSHGGPTGATEPVLNWECQYWTSRGFAVIDVNYGGSSGYGRTYRERLNGRWGIVDVDDCCNAVRYLAERGDVDPARAVITGGSAGGYTTLAALTFRRVFQAGASLFGVSDLEALAKDTHKFESRYLDRLVGPYPADRARYVERSPIHHTGRLSCPVIFFQGLDDKVVPPNQAEMMVEQLRAKGIPVAYLPFEGEGHGFRRAENIKRTIDGQLYFFSRVFGFPLAEPVEAVPIDNLPDGKD